MLRFKGSPIQGLCLAPWLLLAAAPVEGDQAASFTEKVKILAEDGDHGDYFSQAAIDADTLVVGAYGDDDNGSSSGSAYVFERDPFSDGWVQVAKLLADDGEAGDDFGVSVDISGDWIIVGAPENDEIASQAGAAYLFQRDAGGIGSWGLVTKILADDGEVADRFGCSVAIDGDTAIVGAREDDDLGLASGSAYIRQRDEGGPNAWGEVAKLTASDGSALDQLGNSVAIDGDWALVGTLGSERAYIWQRNHGGVDNWGEVVQLSGAAGFGRSTSISGDTAVVGASLDNLETGSADIFQRDVGGPDNWGLVTVLTAIDGAELDRFGSSVSIDGDTIAVAASLDDDRGGSSGSAYVFQRNKNGTDAWGKVAKTIAADGGQADYFGGSIDLSGGMLAVGALFDDDLGQDAGAAYLFEEIVVDPALVVTGSCPGEITFNVAGGTPLGQAVLAFSQSQGSAVLSGGPCAGTGTNLGVVNLLGILPIDPDGAISLGATVPFFVCDLQLQVVDLVSCATSNVTTLP